MNILYKLLDKLLMAPLINHNIIITVALLILVGLNLLGIDIECLSQYTYGLMTLMIINIIITMVVYPVTDFKLKRITKLLEKLNDYVKLSETFIDNFDYIRNKITLLENNIIEINTNIQLLNDELKNLPNIKAIKTALELKSKALWNSVFKECLKYLLTFNKDSAEIINADIKNILNVIRDEYIQFVNKSIKIYDLNETLSSELNNKINISIDLILTELYKNKKVTEKLYIISLLLKSLDEELNIEILTYLRNFQSNLL